MIYNNLFISLILERGEILDDKNLSYDGFPLEQSEEHFRIIQKLAQLGSWRIDLDSGTIVVSKEASRIYGVEHKKYSLEYTKSTALSEYRPMLDEAMKNLIENDAEYDVEFQIKRVRDGVIRDIHSVAEYDKTKRIVTGMIHDITTSKNAERSLQESEERYRSLFDNSVSGIIFADHKGRIIEVNTKMLELLGSPSMEATKKINVLTFPLLVEAGFAADFQKVLETSSVVRGSTRYVSKWGTEHYLEYALNPVKTGEKVIKIIGKVEDITHRKKAEEKVVSLLAEKDTLLKEIYHRLKNNMASIESLLKIQLENSDDPCVIAPLQDAAGRLSSMRVLYDKLYMSADSIHTSIEDYLTTLIDEIFEVFPGSRNIKIVKNIQNFFIPSDKIFPLGLIMNELLTNAFKYAFTDEEKEGLLEISVVLSEGNVRLTVRDNGSGYDFSNGAGKTTGFGLQLIRMLAKQIGGTVDFENDNGAECLINFKI